MLEICGFIAVLEQLDWYSIPVHDHVAVTRL